MYRLFAAILALCVSSGSFAAPIIIEGFDDFDDPGNWQINLTQNHTLNASVTGNVPQYVTSGTANYAGRFLVDWQTATPVAGTANPYDAAGGLTYFAARFNVNAPGSLPNNAIPTDTGLLQADITNESAAPVQVALVVDAAGNSQLERGPFVTVPALGSVTYSWDFATVPPVGFDGGDGAFFGSLQRVKSLLVYSPTAPAVAQTSLLVDNIRNGSGVASPTPAAPVLRSLLGTGTAGEVLVSWEPAGGVVTGYNIYMATDANFGNPTPNRLTFPPAPAKTVAGHLNVASLAGLPTGQNAYVAVAAVNDGVESPRSAAFAIRLRAGAASLTDMIVLDHDAFAPGTPDFQAYSYGQAAVYTAQALGALDRAFITVSAAAVEIGAANLNPNPQQVVVWSNMFDGEDSPSITLGNLQKISAFINNGGNIIVSGTNVAQQLDGPGSPLQTHLHASLLSGDLGLSDITPVRTLITVGPLSTACNPITNAVAYSTTQNDAIVPDEDSIPLALYAGLPRDSSIAGLGYERSLVLLGFAFETAGDPAGSAESHQRRNDLMARMVDYLLVDTAAENWHLLGQ